MNVIRHCTAPEESEEFEMSKEKTEGQKLAEELLEHWQNVRSHFVKVMPLQYKQALLVKAGLI